ncbi:ER membrane complex subunit 3 [Phlyctochytrium planicorne]|nr:ER membrane complex subunit 3 [Phlyctochytrium planicorne]
MVESQSIYLDPAIRNWVLIPIMVVMVLVGILRHHATMLLNSVPKQKLNAVRESSALMRSRCFRADGTTELTAAAFNSRKAFLSTAFEKNQYIKNPETAGQPANPMTDPGGMDVMMEGMKKNMAMIVPQTLIMSWITFFFSGFVLIKLPFPLTLRFKAMLQRGIETPDMDVTWVSSLSWYFLNLFGLKSIYTIILGEENAADGMRDMQAMQQMQPGMGSGAPPDASGFFKSEKEFLDLLTYDFRLKGIEEKVLESYGVIEKPTAADKKTN